MTTLRRLTRDTFTGPWAGLPVAWTDDDRFDEATYRADVERCCLAGAPGVYTAGTTGEFYAQELDEFTAIARATIDVCHAHNTPAMIGVTSTYTLGAMRRAAIAAELGADAIQLALPFWLPIDDRQVVPFCQQVSAAAGDMPLSIYDTARTKHPLTLAEHEAIHAAVPNYLMVKAVASTVGATPEGCRELSQVVNVFVGEHLWPSLVPHGARGGCSSMIYWNPRLVLSVWKQIVAGNESVSRRWSEQVGPLLKFLFEEFGPKGFTDSAYDRLGGVAGGFLKTSLSCRAPYPHASAADAESLRNWYRQNFPEMLDLARESL